MGVGGGRGKGVATAVLRSMTIIPGLAAAAALESLACAAVLAGLQRRACRCDCAGILAVGMTGWGRGHAWSLLLTVVLVLVLVLMLMHWGSWQGLDREEEAHDHDHADRACYLQGSCASQDDAQDGGELWSQGGWVRQMLSRQPQGGCPH